MSDLHRRCLDAITKRRAVEKRVRIVLAERELPLPASTPQHEAITDALARIIERHADAGESQGYTGTGYDYIEHCCGTCGTFGEYGHPWPCADYRDAAKALGVEVTS